MTDEDEHPPALPDAVVSDLLADQRRRYLLYCLFWHANPVTLATVADCVSEWELQIPPEDVPGERLRVYMSLYHDHVPACEDAGVVEYSQPEDTVDLTSVADHLKPYLKRATKRDPGPPDCEW